MPVLVLMGARGLAQPASTVASASASASAARRSVGASWV
jgi:hypothetical protein